jgi:hypothetical protein
VHEISFLQVRFKRLATAKQRITAERQHDAH